MDSINLYDIKAEKANAMMSRHSHLRRLTNFLRVIEIAIVLVLVSRFSLTIPHAFKTSGGIFRDLSAVIFGPRFVFVIGNLIVVVLFVMSGHFSPKKLSLHDDLYREFLRTSKEDKKVTHRHKGVDNSSDDNGGAFVRSKSEVFSSGRTRVRSNRAVLRRSETEKFESENRESDETVKVEKKKKKGLDSEDMMSGEEFRLKVEAFIARQQRFRSMEEEFSSDELEY